VDQVSIKYTIISQDPPKFTQLWILCLKTNHLATLVPSRPGKNPDFFRKLHAPIQGLTNRLITVTFYEAKWPLITDGTRHAGIISISRGTKILLSADQGDQGSMLWSLFSAIFANFLRKKLCFSQKPMLWSNAYILKLCFESKMPIISQTFSAKIYKKS
jgi:hypothetical protein